MPFLFFCFFSGRSYAAPPGPDGLGDRHGSPGHALHEEPVKPTPRRVGDRLYFTPACPIIAENFNETADVNGATSDPSSVGWYLDASKVPSAVYFAVKSHRIKAQTLGGEGVWYSQVFNISGYTGIQVDAKISAEGSFTSSEYVKVSYILDGGPETLIGEYTGNFGTPLVTSAQMTGSRVQIVIRLYNVSAGNNDYYIEQYDVFKEVGPCTVSGITVSAAASNSGVLTCTNPSTTLTASTTASGTTTYSWTGPNSFTATGASVTATAAGTYTVTGTNSAGTGTASVTVTSNTAAPAGVTATASGSLTCATNSVTLTGSSTTAGTTFAWTGPSGFTATGATATATAAGTYTLTATNPTTGCTTTTTVTVTSISTPPAGVTATASGSLTCSTTSVTLTGASTTSGTTFAWAGPNSFTASGATATVTAPGTYTVTATNPSTGCTATASTTVAQNLTAPANVAATNNGPLTCNFTTATMSASSTTTSGVTYTWSGTGSVINYGATGASATTTTPGTYILTATYTSTGCTATAMTTVYQTLTAPGTITASNNGPLTCTAPRVTLSGTSTLNTGVTYAWTGPSSFTAAGSSATTTVPGTYTLTATNTSSGCTATATTTVAQNTTAPAGVTATASGSLTCSTTSVTVLGMSTSAGSQYKWTGPNNFTAFGGTATATVAGTYTITATSLVNGCTATASTTVTSNVTPPAGVAVAPTTATLTCSSPTATLTGTSTTTGVSYAWSGPNGFIATGNPVTTVGQAGTYTLTVTDPTNGCTTTVPATISTNFAQPAGVTATNSGPLSCGNTSVTLTGSSTTGGATFSWTGPNNFTASGATATTTVPGTYTLTATNPSTGCIIFANTVVSQDVTAPAGLTVTTSTNNPVLTCSNTSLTLNAISTTPGVNYSWSNASGPLAIGTELTVNTPGTYTVTATNLANGCSSSTSTNITQNITPPSGLVMTSNPTTAVLTCATNSIAFNANASGSKVGYSWTGPGGFTFNGQTTNISVPGTYSVTATDSTNGCSSTASATVTQNITPPTAVTIASATGTTIINCTNPTLTITGNANPQNVTYSWSGPNSYSSANATTPVTVPGTYTVTATETDNGCSKTAFVVIGLDTASPTAVSTSSVPANATLTCTTPNVVLTGSSSTAGVSYAWTGPNSFASSGAVATVTTPGNYVLTVINPGNGCSSSVTANAVTQNIVIPVGVTANASNKLSCFTTSITITGNSTTSGATYAWAGPGGFTSAAKAASATLGGLYTLTVTNPANGCTASKTLTVVADTAAPAGVTATNNGPLTCDVTTVTLTGNSTTAGVDYTWTGPNGFFDPEQISTSATDSGTYVLTVSNSGNGCSSTATTYVAQDLSACTSLAQPRSQATGRGATLATGGQDSLLTTPFTYKVYPNPVSTVAYIEFQSATRSPVSVEIYNTVGVREVVLFQNMAEANQSYRLTLGTGGLGAGVHYCMIRAGNKVYTSKLLLVSNKP